MRTCEMCGGEMNPELAEKLDEFAMPMLCSISCLDAANLLMSIEGLAYPNL